MVEKVEGQIKEWYQSQKGYFAGALREQMKTNPDIWLITADLGFGMLDKIRDEFPDRYVNVGAAEQAMMGVAVGLALEGKTPFVYSIPNFLIYRPYEWIRNYVDHENLPVKLIGGGRDAEYDEDGFTHQSEDMKKVLEAFPNIVQYWPEDKLEIPGLVEELINNGKPSFLSLRRKK
jgi:transketolase